MRLAVWQMDATNVVSRHPVLWLRSIDDAPSDLEDRVATLKKLLSARFGVEDTTTGSDSVLMTLARAARIVQAHLGVRDRRAVTLDAVLPGSAAFETLKLGLGEAILRRIIGLVEAGPDNATLTAELDALNASWRPLLSHYAVLGAQRHGIPWRLAAASNPPAVELGQGVHRRLFWQHFTPKSSEVGVVFSTHKGHAGHLMREAGLPTPETLPVTSADEALQFADRVGWPVVIKPARSDYGVGITADIRDADTLRSAYEAAQEHGPVLVQRHVEGANHRLLILNGEMLAAVRQTCAHVVGNGRQSVAELIAETNETRDDHLTPRGKKIEIDDALLLMLQRAGLTLESRPETGTVVWLRSADNLSQGGTYERVTEQVHPENRAMAEMAADVFGIDLAGIDLVTSDISRSMHETGGAMIEVNANPGLIMAEPEFAMQDHVLKHFFPDAGRVPVIACLDSALAEILASGLEGSDRAIALATPDALRIREVRLALDMSLTGPERVTRVLSNPRTELAVLCVTPAELQRRGCGLDRIDVALGVDLPDEAALQALLCLDRVSNATVIHACDLEHVHRHRRGTGALWCICEDIGDPALRTMSAVQQGTEGVILKPAGQSARLVTVPEQIATSPFAGVFVAATQALLAVGRSVAAAA